MRRILGFALLCVAIVLSVALPLAFANAATCPLPLAGADVTTVNLTPVTDMVLSGITATIGAVVAVAIGFLSVRVNKWFGVSIDQRQRDALQAAIMTGVHAALERIDAATGPLIVDVKSKVISDGLSYVVNAVPDAIKHFKLSDDMIAEMVAARLNQIASADG
ncbi:hypothetical protein [Camelimonas lactis]|uniref:Uncharacterized protein n=1 Tax=Camelimonas lactis TaxID=659006 RepID=A0A4R2GW34_9HYPH|nr:hypothetical protein [Camelimonas lactis]TCO15199.1 hypothetical protein EV666_102177 [Camelimonas lactis]